MKPLVVEWVSKAEGDFAIVERESRARSLCRSFRKGARQSLGLA